MDNRVEAEKSQVFKYAFLSACGVLLIYILWSVITETLIPLYNEKAYDEFTYNLFGIPLIIFGTGLFAYGGWVFVRDTSRLFSDNLKIADNLDIIKDKNQPAEKIKAARSENTKFLFAAWKKGAFLLLIGAITIVFGGVLTNLKKIIE